MQISEGIYATPLHRMLFWGTQATVFKWMATSLEDYILPSPSRGFFLLNAKVSYSGHLFSKHIITKMVNNCPEMTCKLKSTIFREITPCSLFSVNQSFGGTYLLHLQCHLLSRWFLAQLIFSTLKMEAICSSETSVDTPQNTRRYIPEDGSLHNHRCEDLKSDVLLFLT
jgi:hypothetical protein